MRARFFETQCITQFYTVIPDFRQQADRLYSHTK